MTDKFVSGLPYTDDERAIDDVSARDTLQRKLNRRRAAPHGRYNRKPTAADRLRDLRIVGESRDAD